MAEQQKDWPDRWGSYQYPKTARGYTAGKALAMDPNRKTPGITTMHPTRLLRTRKNGHATTKQENTV